MSERCGGTDEFPKGQLALARMAETSKSPTRHRQPEQPTPVEQAVLAVAALSHAPARRGEGPGRPTDSPI